MVGIPAGFYRVKNHSNHSKLEPGNYYILGIVRGHVSTQISSVVRE